MRTSRKRLHRGRRRSGRALTAAAVSAILALGCASGSMGRDVAAVRELTSVRGLPRVEMEAVDGNSSADALAYLREPLDADRAVRVALLNNRELRAQLRELGIARGRLIQAGLVSNPVVEVESLPERQTSYELRVEYEVSSLILAPVRARAAAADLEAERHAAASAVVRLGFEVRRAMYGLQHARQRLRVARDALGTFASSRETAEQLLAAGNIPPIGAATEVAAHERARVLVSQMEVEVIEARERVQRLLGLHGDATAWEAAPALPGLPASLPGVENAERTAVRASHDLASMTSRLDAAAKRTALSRLEGWLPDMAVDAHALYGRPDSETGPVPAESWQFGGGLSLSLPIFDRQQGATRAHEAEFDGMSERIQGLAIAIRSEVRAAESRHRIAHERARRYAEVILPAQRTVMEQTRLQYNAMQIGVFDLLRARREQLDVELAHVDALHEYWNADATLRALLEGTRIEASPRTLSSGALAGNDSRGDH